MQWTQIYIHLCMYSMYNVYILFLISLLESLKQKNTMKSIIYCITLHIWCQTDSVAVEKIACASKSYANLFFLCHPPTTVLWSTVFNVRQLESNQRGLRRMFIWAVALEMPYEPVNLSSFHPSCLAVCIRKGKGWVSESGLFHTEWLEAGGTLTLCQHSQRDPSLSFHRAGRKYEMYLYYPYIMVISNT